MDEARREQESEGQTPPPEAPASPPPPPAADEHEEVRQMAVTVEHGLVESLLEAADGTDDEIIQLVTRVGPDAALEVIFNELLLDIEPSHREGPELTVQYDLAIAEIVLSHLVTWRDGKVEVRRRSWGPWGGSAGRDAQTQEAAVRLRHTQLEFVELFRQVLGPASARGGRQVLAGALAAGLGDDTWRARFEKRDHEHADLTHLAVRFGSDKWGVHYYTGTYDRYFRQFRDRRIKILEIGVGGYGDADRGGASLDMWKRYFPRGMVYGIDLVDKSGLDTQRIRTYIGNQSDAAFLESLMDEIGPVDIVVDDGSHVSKDVIASFKALFPHLTCGGLYVIEDLETSYWPGFGGSSDEFDNPAIAMGYLKTLVDGMQYEELLRPDGYTPTYTERHIVGIHFFHALAIIEKGLNTEGSAGALVPQQIKVAGFPVDQSQLRIK